MLEVTVEATSDPLASPGAHLRLHVLAASVLYKAFERCVPALDDAPTARSLTPDVHADPLDELEWRDMVADDLDDERRALIIAMLRLLADARPEPGAQVLDLTVDGEQYAQLQVACQLTRHVLTRVADIPLDSDAAVGETAPTDPDVAMFSLVGAVQHTLAAAELGS